MNSRHIFSTFLNSVIFISILFTSIPAISATLITSDNPITVSLSTIKKVEQQLIGNAKNSSGIGISVLDLKTGQQWHYNGNKRFPLMSTFKTLACAKLLNDADNGKININTPVTIKQSDILSYAPITKTMVGKTMTLDKICAATMLTSDNTAANIILSHIGGPQALTSFIRGLNDQTTRLDRIEPFLNNVDINEIRDTTTPNAIASTLSALLYHGALSTQSTQKLKQWMMNNKVSDSLLRAVLPTQWSIADRSGYDGNHGSRGITAAIWSSKRQPLIITIYLGQTGKSISQLNKAIAEIGESIFANY
uniref:class A beta-lactamase n=1 Tax=Moritella sp. 36 TaxID=2746233 RepID=UPI001BA8F437|nr:class A beta-lactamase [Moritella sp. 36]